MPNHRPKLTIRAAGKVNRGKVSPGPGQSETLRTTQEQTFQHHTTRARARPAAGNLQRIPGVSPTPDRDRLQSPERHAPKGGHSTQGQLSPNTGRPYGKSPWQQPNGQSPATSGLLHPERAQNPRAGPAGRPRSGSAPLILPLTRSSRSPLLTPGEGQAEAQGTPQHPPGLPPGNTPRPATQVRPGNPPRKANQRQAGL